MYATFVAVLTAILVMLKLTGILICSWWVVFVPAVIFAILYAVIAFIAMISLSKAFTGKWFGAFK